MTLTIALVAVLAIVVAAGLLRLSRGATRAARRRRGRGAAQQPADLSRACTSACGRRCPALLFLAIWAPVQSGLVDQAVLATPAGQALPAFDMQRDTILAEARDIASGAIEAGFNPESTALAPDLRRGRARASPTIGGAVAIVLALAGAFLAMRRIKIDFRARSGVERWVMVLLVGASLIAILTTLGIVLSLLFESLRFFGMVSPTEFLFGTTWSPQTAMRADQAGSSGAFGSVPLFWGTAFIGAIIAMIVAIPLGLMSAIFLTQYAPAAAARLAQADPRDPRRRADRGLRLFRRADRRAGDPRLRPRDRRQLGEQRKRARGGPGDGHHDHPVRLARWPTTASPRCRRRCATAAWRWARPSRKRSSASSCPPRLPGVVGGVLLAVSRAIGETMIVVMAAGLAANMTANPFASVTTVTVQIVQLLTGDQEFDSAKTLAAFALGLLLFVITLILNLIALRVVRRYREAYE